MSEVGVLCARVRKEEKQILAALEAAGLDARHLPPSSALVTNTPAQPADGLPAPRVIIDRCQNRQVASGLARIYRLNGLQVIDAGLAATGSRTDVAIALSSAGIPRPVTNFVMAEDSAVATMSACGFPATLLPLAPGSRSLPVQDVDIAEALIEHRGTLGSSQHAVLIAQSGLPSELIEVLVVGGTPVSSTMLQPDQVSKEAGELATLAAAALGATVAGVTMTSVADELVVWDINPVPELREHVVFEGIDLFGALCELVSNELGNRRESPVRNAVMGASSIDEITRDSFVLSA